MEQIISHIIGPIANILTTHIIEHVEYATYFTKHVKNMRQK